MGPGSWPSPRRWRGGGLASWHWPGLTALLRRTGPWRGVGSSRAGGRSGGWLETDMVEPSRIWISHLGVSAPWGARPLSWTWWVPSRKRRRRNSVLAPALRAHIKGLASFCRNVHHTPTGGPVKSPPHPLFKPVPRAGVGVKAADRVPTCFRRNSGVAFVAFEHIADGVSNISHLVAYGLGSIGHLVAEIV